MPVGPQRPRFRTATLAGAAVLTLGAAIAAAPASATATAVKKKPTSVSRTSGAVTAKVTYTPANPKKDNDLRHLRLTVTGPGGTLKSAALPHNAFSHTRPLITLTDLNGDGVPDPIVDTFTGGAHCCSVGSIALSTATGFAAPITQSWADYGYRLQTPVGSTTPIFVSHDDRFAYAYTAYAGSIPAIQIWSVAGGTFADVTRNYPDLVRADAAEMAGYWDTAAKDAASDKDFGPGEVQAVTAAWVADLALLGDVAGAKAIIDKTTAAGYMTGGDPSNWGQATTFAGQLSHDQRAWGYLADPTVIGLPAPS